MAIGGLLEPKRFGLDLTKDPNRRGADVAAVPGEVTMQKRCALYGTIGFSTD